MLRCRRCKRTYPIVDGCIPCVLREEPAHGAEFEPGLIANYVLSHFPNTSTARRMARRLAVNARIRLWFQNALSRHRVPFGPALELGCGPGAYAEVWARYCEPTILCDVQLPFVQHVALGPRVTSLRCDAHDPPFRAGSMALVAAVNLLDVTPEPWLLLGQMDALLRPGGIVAIAMPYSANFTGPEDMIRTLTRGRAEIPYLSYDVLESKDWLPWVIPAGERLVHEYRVHALIARKNEH